MKPIAQGGLNKDQVISILKAEKNSRKISFEYRLLDKKDRFKKTLQEVKSASIKHSAFTDIKSVFQFIMKEDESIDYLNDRIQPIVRFEYDKDKFLEWSMGVYLLSSPIRYDSYKQVYRQIVAYDKLQILLDDMVEERYTIEAGTRYIDEIRSLILSTNETKINIENTDSVLPVTKEFDIGTPRLRIINELLSDLNYIGLWVDENGFYTSARYIVPNERTIEFEYVDDDLSITYDGLQEELDLFSVPNKFIVVVSNPEQEPLSAVYINDNPESITSTVNRGRTITDFREIESISNQAALNNHVKMLAYNASEIYGYLEFESAIMPIHSHFDSLRVKNATLGLNDRYIETEWSFDFEAGARMSHRCRKVVQI